MAKGGSSSKKFVLVRWMEDETVGVMPISAVMEDYTPYSGAIVKMRWRGKKLYDAEILKISEDRQNLNKLCEALVNMDISVEDILNEAECDVDSTTTGSLPDTTSSRSVPESPPPAKKTKVAKLSKPKYDATLSKQKAKRAAGTSSEKKKSALAKVAAAKERASSMFSAFPSPKKNVQNDVIFDISSSDDELDPDDKPPIKTKKRPSLTPTHKQTLTLLQTQQSLIDSLKKQLDSIKRNTTLLTPDSRFTDSSKELEVVDSGYNSFAEPHATDHAFTTSTPIKDAVHVVQPAKFIKEEKMDKTKTIKTNPSLIEFVKGYGVKCTQRQLDEVESNSSGSATKMIRHFMDAFFTEEELGQSSCYGSRNNKCLDGDVIAACIKYVQGKHEVAKSVLVEAINDKCAQVRRKIKRRN